MQPCGNSSWCCTQYYPTVNAANISSANLHSKSGSSLGRLFEHQSAADAVQKRKSNPKANLSLPRSMRHSYSAGGTIFNDGHVSTFYFPNVSGYATRAMKRGRFVTSIYHVLASSTSLYIAASGVVVICFDVLKNIFRLTPANKASTS
ncbi:unnamed protein product [Fusarium graminearum]|nr:unnamed protein product [Fusarium graminearum]